jgi:tetratricopeptide (TPR) repeat protein
MNKYIQSLIVSVLFFQASLFSQKNMAEYNCLWEKEKVIGYAMYQLSIDASFSSEYSEKLKALELINKAISLNSNVAEFYQRRAQTYFDLKEYEKAVSDFNQALKYEHCFKEDVAVNYFQTGRCYLQLKLYNLACVNLKSAITIRNEIGKKIPDSYYYFYAESLFYLGKKKEACVQLGMLQSLEYIDVDSTLIDYCK